MKSLTTGQFINLATAIHGDRYDYTKSHYRKSVSKLTITCRIHGDFEQRPNDHISGANGCPSCKFEKIGNLKRSTLESVLTKFRDTHGERYSYDAVKYVNSDTHITVGCAYHGYFKVTPSKHLIGRGCPTCKYSNGERMVAKALDELKIEFENQKTFSGLIGDCRLLKFDFYLPDYDALIEFDGEFHFNHKKCFDFKNLEESEAIERFLKVVEYDAIKNAFATNNAKYLLRIPYSCYTLSRIKKEIRWFINMVKADPEAMDSSGSYVTALALPRPKFGGLPTPPS